MTPRSVPHPVVPPTRRVWAQREPENRSSSGWSEGSKRFDTVVVGGGLTGLITSLLLAQEGAEVLLCEARAVGAGASGATTAKTTLLQGTRLSDVAHRHGPATAATYLRASRWGQEWVRSFCTERDVPFDTAPAYTVALTDDGVEGVEAEHRIAQELGLRTKLDRSLDVPFPVVASVGLEDQLQLRPDDLLGALFAAAAEAGVTLVEDARVTALHADESGVRVGAEQRGLNATAEHVIIATGCSVLDRGWLSSRLEARRSYLCAFDVDPRPGGTSVLPDGMFVSVETPGRSVRTASVDGKRVLLVGGEGHRTGASGDERDRIGQLVAWTREHFPAADLTHAWSAQDHHPPGDLPRVEALPHGHGRILAVGGYSKWGMTSAPAAARMVSDLVLGRDEHLTFGTPALAAVVTDTVTAVAQGVPPTAASAADAVGTATDCGVHRLCTHMGAPLAWNEAERSWDCPLHGSRFTSDGEVLEGPATQSLRRT